MHWGKNRNGTQVRKVKRKRQTGVVQSHVLNQVLLTSEEHLAMFADVSGWRNVGEVVLAFSGCRPGM